MSDVIRTFRLFGAFKASRERGSETAQQTRINLIEIFHADRDGDGKRHCFVRLSRSGTDARFPSTPETVPDVSENIFINGKAEAYLAALVEDDFGQDLIFWISKPPRGTSNVVRGKQLFLSGAMFCDQFVWGAGQVSGDQVPTERFPLRPFYGETALSGASVVTFGHDSEFYMRLELAFAMPFGPKADPDMLAFPCGGVFHTTIDRPGEVGADAFLRPKIALAGVPGDDVITRARRRFGQFGYADAAQETAGVFGIRLNNYYPHGASLTSAFGLQIRDFDSRRQGRYLFLSERVEGSDSFNYVAALSRHLEPRSERLDLRRQLGISLRTDSLDLQAVLKVSLDDDLIRASLAAEQAIWEAKTTLRLRFSDAIQLPRAGGGLYQFRTTGSPTDDRLRGCGLLHVAALGAQVRDALPLSDRQPQSILPDLYRTSRQLKVAMVGYARGQRQPAFEELPNVERLPHLSLTLDLLPPSAGSSTSATERAETFLSWDSINPLDVIMRLPGFTNGGERQSVRFLHDPHAREMGEERSEVSILIANGSGDGPGFSSRLGALALAQDEGGAFLVQPSNDQLPGSALVLRRRKRRGRLQGTPDIEIRWQLNLALNRVRPITTDVPHGDRDDRPDDLLIPENPGEVQDNLGNTRPLRLMVRESIHDNHDRHLTAELFATSADTASLEPFTVISQRPWQMMRFTRLPFAASGGETAEAVSTYDSDQRDWRLLKAADTYRYTLPPAVVGEAADKPGELEIVDPKVRPAAGDLPLTPAPRGSTKPYELHAVDMRLSPPSTVWVEPSDLERNYFLAPYNVRALFRQQGDFGIGVALHALQSEFIYGIASGLKVPDATETKAKPRLASTSAIVGRMLRPDVQDNGSLVTERWNLLRDRLTDHAERLEVVDIDTSRRNPYQPARFAAGLTHAQRHTALIQPPAGLKPEDVGDVVQTSYPGLKPTRFADHGLAGGALWPLESANVARVLAQNPVSDGGTLEKVALSPLGVSGDQSVGFLQGYVTVISETSEGRLHRHRVEVLGRIGALWHRAKHVVIYERTTAPSAQFVPEGDHQRSARPILRKVEEFIEILEPVRTYPDTPSFDQRDIGCLEEVRFNSTVIHVNSAWGTDLGKFGWKVPLWNRHAASIRPQVYPFPDVSFVSTAEGDSVSPQVSQDCIDVQNLFFVTDPHSAQDIGPNTDLWPARLHVDYWPNADSSIISAALEQLEPKLKDGAGDGARRRPAASRLLPGVRGCTWRVAPAPVRARLNAGRGDKPIFAGVESFTLSRNPANQKAPAELDTKLGSVVGQLIENAPVALPDAQRFPLDGAVLPNSLSAVGVFRKELQAFVRDPTLNQVNLREAASNIAAQPGSDPLTLEKIDDAVNGNLRKAHGLLTSPEVSKLYKEVLEADSKDCEALATKARDALKRRKMLMVRLVREATDDLRRDLGNLGDYNEQALRNKLMEEINAVSNELLGGLAEGVVDVREALANAKAIAGDWRAQTALALRRAQARVGALRGTFDSSKPWSDNRLRKALAQIEQAFDGAGDEAARALTEARQRFASDLNGEARAVGTVLSKTIQQAIETGNQALTGLGSLSGAVHDSAKQIEDALARLPQEEQMDSAILKLEQAAARLGSAHQGIAREAIDLAVTAKDAIKVARTSGSTFAGKYENVVIEKIEELKEKTTEISVQAISLVNDAQEKLAAFKAKVEETAEDFQKEALNSYAEFGDTVLKTFEQAANAVILGWKDEITAIEGMISRAESWAEGQIRALDKVVEDAHKTAGVWFNATEDALDTVEKKVPEAVREAFNAEILKPLLDAAFGAVVWPVDVEEFKAAADLMLRQLSADIEEALDQIDSLAMDGIAEAKELCESLVGLKNKLIDGLLDVTKKLDLAGHLKGGFDAFLKELDDFHGDVDTVIAAGEKLLDNVAEVANEVAEAADHAQAYVTRGLDIIRDIGDGKPEAVPGLALKLVSAVTTAPEIAAFKVNADRIRVVLEEAKDTLKTPELRGLFDQIGGALKALGLDFKFESFSDQFKIEKPDGNFLRNLLPDFGGIDLSNMLPEAALPEGFGDAVKVTHDLDVKKGRAWVQADVNLKMLKREKMFTIGPFTLYLRKSSLDAQVRAEASKDSKEVDTTDSAALTTTIEAVIGGQIMVTLEDVVIRYSSKSSLKFEIDPKKIKIHKSLKFIQDTIGEIFGDDVGGLKFVKQNGIPVGVEHQFAMPPISLMYGTSGVSNIQIANRFSLRAYPDFIISNRFNLSRPELPFLFSFFIIGGTGFLQVDTAYRPFDSQLMVVATAGAGGSAALGFAFGPVSGSVFITLSVVLRYQKRIGGPTSPDDGLSVSLLLVIAGHVSLWGIVTVYLGLRLSISYHESGRVDGLGQLSVEVRISRFFKLKYATSITYKLRDGKSSTQRVDSTEVSGEAVEAVNKVKSLAKARKSL